MINAYMLTALYRHYLQQTLFVGGAALPIIHMHLIVQYETIH